MNKIETISKKIYNYLDKKYPNLKTYNLELSNIQTILSKTKIDNKNDISNIISKIEEHIKKVNTKANNILNYTQDTKTKINYDKKVNETQNEVGINNQFIEQISNLKEQYNPVSESFPLKEREKLAEIVTPETIDRIHYIVIDSKDRNTSINSPPNNYTIQMSPSNDKSSGYISKGYLNVKSIELIDCILKDTSTFTNASNNGSNFPYILLEIDELGSMFEGTNNELSKSFAILKNYTETNGFFYYNLVGNSSNDSLIKYFYPNKSLSKLTIKFKTPDGSLFNFGDEATSSSSTINKLVFRIVVSQKNLTTQFMDKSTF